jgi:pilus assembly protein CpaE
MTSLRLVRNWRAYLIGPAHEAVRSARALLVHEVPSIHTVTIRGYPAAGVLDPPSSHQPAVCLIDAISNLERAIEVVADLRARRPEVPVVALVASCDPAELVLLLRHGFDEFLMTPFTVEQLNAVFQRLLRARPELQGANPGRVIAVLPAKGGCGASGLAIELASDTAALGVQDAVLLDLDPFAGLAAMRLGIRPERTFLDAIARSDGLDAEGWRELVYPVRGGAFHLLPAPDSIEEAAYRLETATPLIDFARTRHECLVADAAGLVGPWNESIAREADDLLVVTTASRQALKATQRCMRRLSELGVPARKVRVILNRYRPDVDFSLEVIEAVLGREVHAASGDKGMAGLRSLRDQLAEPAPALTP